MTISKVWFDRRARRSGRAGRPWIVTRREGALVAHHPFRSEQDAEAYRQEHIMEDENATDPLVEALTKAEHTAWFLANDLQAIKSRIGFLDRKDVEIMEKHVSRVRETLKDMLGEDAR